MKRTGMYEQARDRFVWELVRQGAIRYGWPGWKRVWKDGLCGLLAAVVVMTGLTGTGCRSVPQPQMEKPKPVAAEPPPGVDPSAIAMLEGAALEKARLSLREILERLPRPEYLPVRQTEKEEENPEGEKKSEDSEPPVEAQYAYVAGRSAYLAGQSFEAIRKLQEALSLAPRDSHLLALLGEIYLVGLRNRVRGTLYLQQAVQADPEHPGALFLLARSEMDENRMDRAIVLLAEALEAAEKQSDPGMVPVVRYVLAGALERERYDAAAVAEYRQLLEKPLRLGRTTRFALPLLTLEQQRGLLWQQVGDACCRLGRFEEAVSAYQRAVEDKETTVRGELISRVVYANLRAGRPAEAVEQVLKWVHQKAADPLTPRLVEYLARQPIDKKRLKEGLREIYLEQNRPAELAMVTARLMSKPEARRFLDEHLKYQPRAWEVLRERLRLEVSQSADRRGTAEAIRLAAGWIEKNKSEARRYADLLMEVVEKPAGLEEGIESFSTGERSRAAVRFIRGLALAAMGREQEAVEQLRAAVKTDPELKPARWELVQRLIGTGQLEEARETLEAAAEQEDPEAVMLRIRILQKSGQNAAAMELLDRELRKRPGDARLVLSKVQLLMESGQPEAGESAETLLLEALQERPTEERFYQALFEIYNRQLVPEAARRRTALLQKALQNVPHSTAVRLEQAAELIRTGQVTAARRILEELLSREAREYRALELLLVAMERAGQRTEAQQMLEQKLGEDPSSAVLLGVAQRYYLATGQNKKFLEVTERLLKQTPASPRRDCQLAAVYLRTGRVRQAQKLLEELIERTAPEKLDNPVEAYSLLGRALVRTKAAAEIDRRFSEAIRRHPQQKQDLLFEWAMMLERLDQRTRAAAMLEEILGENPNHGRAANALGYGWADRGIHLDRAEELIRRALKEEPENPAYLDSLGWVFYKRGQIEEAVEYLTKARLQPGGDHPVILDHLGDALYRLGKKEEAGQYWKLAQQAIDPEEMEDDPDLRRLPESLKEKLEALAAGREVKVADLARPEEIQRPAENSGKPEQEKDQKTGERQETSR